MESHGITYEGFKRRPQKKRKPRNIKPFPWVRDPYGIVGKVLLGLVADKHSHARDVVVTRKFKNNGVTDRLLYEYITKLMPWFADYYEEYTGRKLTPSIVYDRFHKQVYEYKDKTRAVISNEDFHKDPKLRPWISVVDDWYIKGRPISKEQIDQAVLDRILEKANAH